MNVPPALPPTSPFCRMDPFDPFGAFGQEPVERLTSDWKAGLIASTLRHWTMDDLHAYLGPLGGLNAQDGHGYTVLMGLAMQKNDPTRRNEEAWCDRLLRAGVPVNHRGHDGHSALSLALQNNLPMLAERLLNAGADPHLADVQSVPYWISDAVVPDGRCGEGSVLHLALGHPSLLERLLQQGVNPNVPGERGQTPVQQALVRRLSAAVCALLRHGADLPDRILGVPPLVLGLPGLLPSAIQALVRHGADPTATGPDGKAAMDRVMDTDRPFDDVGRWRRRQQVIALLEAGVNPTVRLLGDPGTLESTAVPGVSRRANAHPSGTLLERALHDPQGHRIDWSLVLHLVQACDVPLSGPDPWALPSAKRSPTLWDRVRGMAGDVTRGSVEQQDAYRRLVDAMELRQAAEEATGSDAVARTRSRL